MPNINKILRQNRRNTTRGCPMGDTNFHDDAGALCLQRVDVSPDGYAPDATYWGRPFDGTVLWCAFNRETAGFAPAMGTRIYVRATDRAHAAKCVHALYPNAITFLRGPYAK